VSGEKVLITGVTGFIGRNLAGMLLADKCEVYGISRRDHFSKGFPLGDRVHMVWADILDRESIAEAVKSVKPDILIHLAALTPVRLCFAPEAAEDYMRVNYMGTVNVVEAARRAGVEIFVHYSTAEVYLTSCQPHKVSDPIGGETPYGISKAAAELYARHAWLAGYLRKLLILRPSNTYDRSMMEDEVSRGYFVEKTIISMLKGVPRIDYDGSQLTKRSWLHIDDHVEYALWALDFISSFSGDALMICNLDGPAAMCGKIVDICKELTGWEGEVTWNNRPRPWDPPSLTLAKSAELVSKEKEMSVALSPGFEPSPLREGLDRAVWNWKKRLEEESRGE